MANGDSLKRLQSLFRELFQLDFADLDFGIYRLFHIKRAEIERFINEQLPREVDVAFRIATDKEKEQLKANLEKLAQEVRKQISEDAILQNGEANPQYQNINLVKQYAELRSKLSDIETIDGHKDEVFNHLYNFFSRYYEDGDFIPKRRYGTKETYAVPYNGEEIFFTWANRDQHYVKTGETFKDYAFKVSDLTGVYRVRFTMVKASIPKDNTKGNTRYFYPRPELASYDEETREFVLPFEYRLPTPEETEQYGTNSKAQDAILEKTLPHILEVVSDVNLRALLSQPTDDSENALTVLQKRLRHFCRRNTSDYFIHKDLRGFLTRELEFYIKDQIIHLMDLEGDLGAKRRVVRTFRKLAEKVIDFLATIEDTQKTLFEKKKFVLETDYLIPIQHVPRKYWPEILANQAQLTEWRSWLVLEPEKNLFYPEGEINEVFLESHPTLPVHTRHFNRDFVCRLLEALPFEDLDEATDGLLVHSENYQGLRLLLERYREQVKCIYIDPPYNTGSDEFLYKDRYQHSSWLAMMEDRLWLAREWMREDGAIFVSIDDGEQARLREMMESVFGAENFVNNVVWQKKFSPQNDARWLSDNHDFLLCFSKYKGIWRPGLLPRTEDQDKRYQNPDNDPRGPWMSSDLTVKTYSPDYDYPITTPSGRLVYPPEGRCWFTSKEKMQELITDNRIWFGPNGDGVPRLKRFLSETKQGITPLTIWIYKEVGHNQEGKQELKRMLTEEEEVFGTPKPVRLLSRVVTIGAAQNDIVLDFFAGSGTTGHAVINLNREDGGRRKFILVEMDEYFDTILLPRIAKVMYTPEWKDGKPKRNATPQEAERTPRLVKILRLESYEDALHNMAAPSTLERVDEHEKAYKALVGEDEYRLYYWIELPLKEAETCLRTLDLAHPYTYSLEILTDDGPVRKPVDVVETFIYLYGLRVRRYETWHNPMDNDREYRVVKATDREGKRRVLVLWRDMEDLDPETERAFLEAKISEMEKNGQVWDEILINGDSPTPRVTSLDPLFKRLMMQEEGV